LEYNEANERKLGEGEGGEREWEEKKLRKYS